MGENAARKRAALVAVDVQNDFCPGGALPVAEGHDVVPALNRYMEAFSSLGLPVYLTRDWHPPATAHFRQWGGQWPPHCVQGTSGAEFHGGLMTPPGAVVITKGDRPGQDGYSGFDGHDEAGVPFARVLERDGVGRLFVGGLATDYCVRQTVLDGLERGFEVTVLVDAVRGVDASSGDSDRALAEMSSAGAHMTTIEKAGIYGKGG